MTVQAYLREDGSGEFADFLVGDLISAEGPLIEVLLVLESPHVDERRLGHPLAGSAGRAAQAFLARAPATGQSLGDEVARLQARRDFRVGILNVSRVPLQRRAMQSNSVLSHDDWDQVEALRRSQAQVADRVKESLRPHANILRMGLEQRVARLNIGPATTVAAAGKFAQMFWRSLLEPPACCVLEVPHPARGQWKRSRGDGAVALEVLRQRYAEATGN